MNILIGTYEIAGWVSQYKEGFEKLGHNVTTAITEKNPFYQDHDYDIYLHSYINQYKFTKKLNRNQYFLRTIRKIQNKTVDLLYKNHKIKSIVNASYEKYIFNLIDQHDVIIKIWRPFLLDAIENEYIRKSKKKFIQLFVGSDIRYINTFKQEFDVSQWKFPQEFSSSIDECLELIRPAEKFADIIYSVPDQAGLQLKPYYHLQVPVSDNGIKFCNYNRKAPKVLHAPSFPYKKGTDIIEKTLSRLKEEGIEFDFISVRNMPHKQLLELLTDADVLVDEIVGHGPGALSFEAMFSGCAVATRYLSTSPECFRPPVWPIDAGTIYKQLKELLTNQLLRKKLIEEGIAYARKNNTAENVVKNMLDDLSGKRAFDYYPGFLRNNYHPVDEHEISSLNEWTNHVQNTEWYNLYIKKGDREALSF